MLFMSQTFSLEKKKKDLVDVNGNSNLKLFSIESLTNNKTRLEKILLNNKDCGEKAELHNDLKIRLACDRERNTSEMLVFQDKKNRRRKYYENRNCKM